MVAGLACVLVESRASIPIVCDFCHSTLYRWTDTNTSDCDDQNKQTMTLPRSVESSRRVLPEFCPTQNSPLPNTSSVGYHTAIDTTIEIK